MLPDGRPLPTAGRLVGRAIERQLVHGEGDALGAKVRLSLPWWYILNRIYEFNPDTGQLAHDRVLIVMGKGNAKTERIGQLGVMELDGPIAPERSPRVVLSAASYDQSIELFNAARISILGDPDNGRAGPLAAFYREGEEILEDRILLPNHRVGRLERTTTVGGTNDGAKPTAHLFDELHEYLTTRAERLFIVGSKSLRKRQVIRRTPASLGLPAGAVLWGSLLIGITTPGADRDSLLGRLYEHGVRVAKGEILDPGFLFMCWEADERWDLDDPAQLRQAILEGNPEAGGFLPISNLEASFRDPTISRAEAVRYNLSRWPDAETRWMPAATWDGRIASVALDPGLPLYVAVAVGDGHRTAAIGMAQRQGEQIALRVEHFSASGDDFVPVEQLESSITALRRSHPAIVLAPRRLRPGGPERILPTAGPEIVHNGAFFEGSAQRLRAAGAAVIDIPISSKSPGRLREAGDTLRTLTAQALLVHEDDPELARQVGNVVERPSPTGAYLAARPGRPTAAAFAAMAAVHRAVTAPRINVKSKPHYGVGF